MKNDVLDEIVSSIKKDILKDNSIKKNYEFSRISRHDENCKIVFVDGGQAEILRAVDFSLQMIRTVAVSFKNNSRADVKRKEFFVLIRAIGDSYKASVFGGAEEDFSAYEKALMTGDERVEISKIGGVVRRFAEIENAKEIVPGLSSGDIIVLDGSLKCVMDKEKERLKELISAADSKEILISALAKTSRQVNENGECLISSISRASENLQYNWYVELKNEGYRVFVVKLNLCSNYIFEFNVFKDADKVLAELVSNSKDAAFPGYPYGLVLADKFARISNEEKERILMQIKMKAGKEWLEIKKSLNVLNGHDVLDSIS